MSAPHAVALTGALLIIVMFAFAIWESWHLEVEARKADRQEMLRHYRIIARVEEYGYRHQNVDTFIDDVLREAA